MLNSPANSIAKSIAVDPDLPRQRRTLRSGVVYSALSIILALYALGRLPQLDYALNRLNTTLQAHNDAIVGSLLTAIPFGFVAIASFGLVYKTLGVLNKAGRSA